MAEWQQTAPTEPDAICVRVQRGMLMAVDCDIGTLPVQMLHDGLTECEWMRGER